MSEQTETRLTSADIKKQIEAKKEELKNSGLPITGQMANEINASASTPVKTVEVQPEPVKAANGVQAPKDAASADLEDWAKKKGIDWTKDESVLSALRKSDQQFHEKRAKEKASEPQTNNIPAYQQPYQAPYMQPVQTYPQGQNRGFIEAVAKQYNLPVEDAERLLAFNKDFYDAASRQDRDRYQKELESIKRENQKNSVFRELSTDPVFKRPDVMAEFYRVMEEMQSVDPKSFEEDPNAYMRAYDKAQMNLFRRNLEGQPLQEGISPMPKPPINPPRPLGQGSGGGSLEKESGIDPAKFAKLSLEEKTKMLEGMGLRPAY